MTHQRNLFPDDPEQQHMFDAQAQGDPPAARRPLTPADIDRSFVPARPACLR